MSTLKDDLLTSQCKIMQAVKTVIRGRTFVLDLEIRDLLDLNIDAFGEDLDDEESEVKERIVIESIVKKKLREHCFPNDNPFKEDYIDLYYPSEK